MKLGFFIALLLTLNSCNLIRLLNTSEQKDESAEEIETFLSKKKYSFDYSFENIDSTSNLLSKEKYRLNDSNVNYSYIQLRIYDSTGNLYSGYSQCMGSFNKKKIIDSFPPSKNTFPFINKDLKFINELNLIKLDSLTKNRILTNYNEYDYVFVVYWTIWTQYFSKHVLKEVSKVKQRESEKILVILVNTAVKKSGLSKTTIE